MQDFFIWFLSRHWLVAAILFPELSLVWAVWQRQMAWACVLGVFVILIKGWKVAPYIIVEWPPRLMSSSEAAMWKQ